MERNSSDFKEKVLAPNLGFILGLAQVQGGWDEKSKDILKSQGVALASSDMGGTSFAEKAVMSVVVKAVQAFMGDGSVAGALVGHEVVLSDEARGIIILRKALEGDSFEPGSWESAAVIKAEILNGVSFENINSRFKKGMGGLLSAFEGALKLFKKLYPGEPGESDASSELKNLKNNNILGEAFGNTSEEFMKTEDKLRQEVIGTLAVKLRMRSQTQLMDLSDKLKNSAGDDMVDSGMIAARKIFASILKERSDGILSILEGI